MRLYKPLLMGLLICFSSSSLAQQEDSTIVLLNVTYTPPTCTISGSDGESLVKVDFGVLERDPNSWASQPIPIKLVCDDNTKSVTAKVVGDTTEHGNLQTTGVNGSVEIGFFAGGIQIPVGQSFNVNRQLPLQLDARPLATGKQIPVEGGEFTAKATLQVDYQ